MSTPLFCVLLLAAWTALLVLTIGLWRAMLVLVSRRPANSFAPAGGDATPLYDRLIRAHQNCVENVPIFAAVILALELSGLGGEGIATAAVVLVAGRLIQSAVHLISTSNLAVQARFFFFLVQLGAVAMMVVHGIASMV